MVGERAFHHEPVMVDEVVAVFAGGPEGIVVDATVGGGGHARALLEADPRRRLLGLDQDPAAITAATAALAGHRDRVTLQRARFDAIAEVVKALGHDTVAGVLFDLGVSSPQLDVADRGFSYRHEAPLDMRMDPARPGPTAADVVNDYDEAALASVLRRHGDERFAARIARSIVAARPIRTTTQLAAVVRDAIPAATRRRGPHPATRTFQALRIEVNRELEILPGALDAALDLLGPGGRVAVLAYHSGEDRIVKDRLAHAARLGRYAPPAGLPAAPGDEPTVRLLWRGARTPRPDEIAANSRAASARLRAVERLPHPREAA